MTREDERREMAARFVAAAVGGCDLGGLQKQPATAIVQGAIRLANLLQYELDQCERRDAEQASRP